jgi:hypothetical protein
MHRNKNRTTGYGEAALSSGESAGFTPTDRLTVAEWEFDPRHKND